MAPVQHPWGSEGWSCLCLSAASDNLVSANQLLTGIKSTLHQDQASFALSSSPRPHPNQEPLSCDSPSSSPAPGSFPL
ncbi:hypothetical protein CapIbe_022821 [Capra ibex]